jgi:mono/diheme cytochrome c family protein
MKRALMFILTVLLGWGTVYAHAGEVSEKYENMVNPVEVTKESLEAGKNIYTQRCATCHGTDGKGVSQGMPDFTNHEMMEEMGETSMFQKISEGVPGTPMPPWEDILSEKERWMVINYINTFHHKETAQPAGQPFSAAPEKGVCGPTALLLIAALPAILVGRRLIL